MVRRRVSLATKELDSPPFGCVILSDSFACLVDLTLHTGGMLRDSIYVYQNDLLALDTCIPQEECCYLILSNVVSTPLRIEAWYQELHGHPDTLYSKYILQDIMNGFRIGFNRSQYIRSTSKNMRVE